MIHDLIFLDSPEYVFPIIISLLLLCLRPTTPQFVPGLCNLPVYPFSMHVFSMPLSSQILSSCVKLKRCPSSLKTPYLRNSYTFFMISPWLRIITSSPPPWTYLLNTAFP